jgi:hypothetical protein
MNSYCVLKVSNEMLEIDADFYQSDGVDLVFYSSASEALRVPSADVAGVTKASTRPLSQTPISEHDFL